MTTKAKSITKSYWHTAADVASITTIVVVGFIAGIIFIAALWPVTHETWMG